MPDGSYRPGPVCRFPGCTRRVVSPPPGQTGRPSAYCADPAHTRTAAYRARRGAVRSAAQDTDGLVPGAAPAGEPVSAARVGARALVERAEELADGLLAGCRELLDELRTLGDPEAAEVEIATVTAAAEQRRAEAQAVAAQAVAARRECERQRDEAVAAAEEALTVQAEIGVRLEQAEAGQRSWPGCGRRP